MNCCDTSNAIVFVRGDDTNFNGQTFLTLHLRTTVLDLSNSYARLTLGDVVKTYNDISSGIIEVEFTSSETSSFPEGRLDGILRIYDKDKKRGTIESFIPFYGISNVHGNAIATKPFDMTINVEQGGENILNIDVEAGVSVQVGTTETLPAGSNATVENVGTPGHLVLNFGIPKGDKGEDGAEGPEGPAGQDAKINGFNTLTVIAKDGLTGTQTGTTFAISGEALNNLISNINALIPEQASDQNQLADKNFVNSSVQTATANFRGNWDDWADVPTNADDYPVDYAGSKTPTVNDYLVVQDASDYTLETLEGTWRFKYSGTWATDGKNGWLPEYQVNETPLTAAQLAALNSGATTTNIGQITTNQNNIGDLSTLTTTANTNLVSAINEVNSTAGSKVSDVQVDGVSVVSSGVASISRANGNTFGAVKINSPNGIAMSSNGQLYINKATDAEIEAKTNNYKPIVPANLDKSVVEGVSDNSITLTDTQKKKARTWQGVANACDLVPDFDSMTPIETHTFDVDTTDFYELFTLPNAAGTYTNATDAQFEVWCRIITTNKDGTSTTPRIYQELDCVFREFGSTTQVIYGVILAKPEAVTAAATGIQNLRSVCPKSLNSGKKFAIEVKPYNVTARKITVQVYKTAQYVTWNDTAVTTTYDSNHQGVYTCSPYNNPGYVFLGTIIGGIANATTAGSAGYLTGSVSKTLASSTLKNTGYNITGNSLLFKVKGQALLAGIQNTTVAIDTDFGICQAGTTAASTATSTYTYTNFFQKHQFTPASSVNFAEAYQNGDMIYARFTLNNGEIYSDNICSTTPTAGHTWYCIGMATSASAINFDNTDSYFFTLDASGKITHINGKEIASNGGGGSSTPQPRTVYDKTSAITSGTVALADDTIFYTDTPAASTTYTIDTTALTQTGTMGCLYFNVLINMPSTAVGIDFTTNNSVTWTEGTTPDMSTGGRTYLLAFQSFDAGTSWIGSLATWWTTPTP